MTTIYDVFKNCVDAIRTDKLITRENRADKEFHFQNWFKARIGETGHHFDDVGRNTYPDFRMVHLAEGYEVKSLAYPGRDMTYDSNSQVPTGKHNGREIFYVFGRYPAKTDGNEFPVLDLVICHGDFLNADHDYVHKNKSVKGFGSYGDIMIRDRKMYVAPTPFGIASGLAHRRTLILPSAFHEAPPEGFVSVGNVARKETEEIIVGYSFDLTTNEICADRVPNPNAGKEHQFTAWRLDGCNDEAVTLRNVPTDALVAADEHEEE